MAFGHFIDPKTQQYTDDHLISKAMEALWMEFRERMTHDEFLQFSGSNWERAKGILNVEGRDSLIVRNSLRPFAEGFISKPARQRRMRKEVAEKMRGQYPQMSRLIEKGLL